MKATSRSFSAFRQTVVHRNRMPSICLALYNIVRTSVERTIAWLNRCRRLAKDWENLNRKALAFLRPPKHPAIACDRKRQDRNHCPASDPALDLSAVRTLPAPRRHATDGDRLWIW